jgi:hypothetical protein
MDCFALLATTVSFVSWSASRPSQRQLRRLCEAPSGAVAIHYYNEAWIASRCSQRRHLLSPGLLRAARDDGIFRHLDCFALLATTAFFVTWIASRCR